MSDNKDVEEVAVPVQNNPEALILANVNFPNDPYGKTEALKRALKAFGDVRNEEIATIIHETLTKGIAWFERRYAANVDAEAIRNEKRVAAEKAAKQASLKEEAANDAKVAKDLAKASKVANMKAGKSAKAAKEVAE